MVPKVKIKIGDITYGAHSENVARGHKLWCPSKRKSDTVLVVQYLSYGASHKFVVGGRNFWFPT